MTPMRMRQPIDEVLLQCVMVQALLMLAYALTPAMAYDANSLLVGVGRDLLTMAMAGVAAVAASRVVLRRRLGG